MNTAWMQILDEYQEYDSITIEEIIDGSEETPRRIRVEGKWYADIEEELLHD